MVGKCDMDMPKMPHVQTQTKKHIITWPLAAGLAWNLPNLLRKLGAPIFMAEGKHFVFRITSPQAFSCDAWSTTTGKILIKDSDATVAPSLVCEPQFFVQGAAFSIQAGFFHQVDVG